jgi:hypothetical protein
MSKKISDVLTSYDLIKAFAVIIMVIDHAGHYLFPDEMLLRLIGRIGFPVWFFLVGYAKSWSVDKAFWIWAILLQVSHFPFGNHALPLNALFTMIAIRLCIDPLMHRVLCSPLIFWGASVVFLVLGIPTSSIVEYGTLGLLFAMFGWLVRHRDDLEEPDAVLPQFFAFCVGGFVLTEYIVFGFAQWKLLVLFAGTFAVCGVLYVFKPMTYLKLDSALPWLIKAPIKLMGRRTMEIYVLHLIALKALSLVMQPDRFQPFHMTLFP